MIDFGDVPAGSVLPIKFASYGGTNGESITLTGLAATDIEVYSGTSMTQRASDNGYTLLDTDGIDIDGITGIHGFSIDLGDNSDSGFFAVGTRYTVIVSAVTIDSQTVNFIAAQFRIVAAEAIAGKPKVDVDGWLGTACATPTVAGVPEVDVTHYAGSTTDVSTIPARIGDILTDTGTTLDTKLNTAQADLDIITGVGGVVIADGTLTNAKFATGAFEKVWTQDFSALIFGMSEAGSYLTGTDGAVDGLVISVSSLTTELAKVPKSDGTVSWNATAMAAINAQCDAAIETYHLHHLFHTNYDPASKPGAADALLNELVENDGGVARFTANALEQGPGGGSAPTAGQIADAVWDEAAADHNSAGTTGNKLNSAASAGDPWSTNIPGAYAQGTAGHKLGNLETNLAASGVEVRNPVLTSAEIDITRNADYYTADGRDLEFSFRRDYVPTSCILKIACGGESISIPSTDITESSGSGSGLWSVRFEIPRATGDDLPAGTGTFDVFSVLSNGHEVPEISEGKATVRRRLT